MTARAGTHLREAPPPAERVSAPQDLRGTRILVVMPSIPVLGMERANLQIMKMMRERGAEVLFVTDQNYGQRVQQEVERIGCQWAATRFGRRLGLPKGPLDFAGIVTALARGAWGIRRIARAYRPTHLYFTNIAYILFGLPTARTGLPVIFRVPNPPDTHLTPVKQRLSNWIWQDVVEPVCDVIVCNSRHTFRELERIVVRTRKARVIYNCVPERQRTQPSDAPCMDRDNFNIVFVGQITAAKGVRELVDAAVRLVRARKNVSFYIAGDHEWRNPFAKGLMAEVARLGLEQRIRFTGEIQDITGLLAQCDLHVCPSVFEEPFGIVVLEAKNQGIPSVVFPSGGLTEVVTPLVDGYVCNEKSADALCEGITYFLDDPAALAAASEAARMSLVRFSTERASEEWAAVFREQPL